MSLKIYFLSSNRIKRDHFKYLLKDYDIRLLPPKDYGQAYFEPRITDRDALLEFSLTDANRRLGRSVHSKPNLDQRAFSNFDIPGIDLFQDEINEKKAIADYQNNFFFIEDTSVKITALSKAREYPGVDIKYWMKGKSFSDIDSELRSKGNDREAIVRSDIVLYIPKKYRDNKSKEYEVFVGETLGSISEEEFNFDTNLVYPWLDNKTFNKWFIPKGKSLPISMLHIKESTEYDFRAKALQKMVQFLKEKGIIKERIQNRKDFEQRSLFDLKNMIFCGPSCTGKTVLANHISEYFGYYHIEASDYMKLAYNLKHGFESTIGIHDFASEVLKEEPDIVSSEVLNEVSKLKHTPVVITGFRSPEELSYFLDVDNYKVFYIESRDEDRFNRNLDRGRDDALITFEDFKEKDKTQYSMGLIKIKDLNHVILIENKKDLYSYLNNFEKEYIGDFAPRNRRHLDVRRIKKLLTLEQAILISMLIEKNNSDNWLTTAQISKKINIQLDKYRRGANNNDIVTNRNNVSRYFNQKLHVFYKTKIINNIKRYKLSSTGESQAYLVLSNVCSAS